MDKALLSARDACALTETNASEDAPRSSHVQIRGTALDQGALLEASPAIVNTVEDGTSRAKAAQREWAELSTGQKRKIINYVRSVFEVHAEELAEEACHETCMGRVDHKIEKNLVVTRKTPGPEFLNAESPGTAGPWYPNYVPYGVVSAVTPITNPVSTIINNAISLLSAGNAVVFLSHPGALGCSANTVSILHQAIVDAGGPAGCVSLYAEKGRDAAAKLISHPDINLVVVTGGPKLVRTAYAAGKKVIAGGPGNPPALVDESADLPSAAECLIRGASFDNNILCIGEKEVVALSSIADELVREMVRRDAYLLRGEELERATALLVDRSECGAKPNRAFVGKSPAVIMRALGIPFEKAPRVLLCETTESHPFVQVEMLMPLLPVVRADTFADALVACRRMEHNFRHTAIIHSNTPRHIELMRQAMQVTMFAVNAPSYAAVGIQSNVVHTSFTLATPTGEGPTTCRTFARNCGTLQGACVA